MGYNLLLVTIDLCMIWPMNIELKFYKENIELMSRFFEIIWYWVWGSWTKYTWYIVAISMAKICLYNTTHNIGFLNFIFSDCGIITVLILATILGLKISNQSIQRSGSLRLRALLTFELLNWFKSGVQKIFLFELG